MIHHGDDLLSRFDPVFWKGKRVLITGHTGFMGSWLCLWLELLGAEVHGIALDPSTSPSLYEEAGMTLNGSHSLIDIRDMERLGSKIRQIEPGIIFHLAAQPLVLSSYADPIGTFNTNVMGTAHVLECARNLKTLKAALIVTSDKCYKNEETHRAFVESDPLGGDDPYSASKGAAEIVVQSYRRSFFKNTPIITCRAGNIIGGGDWSAARLVPDIMRSLSENIKVPVRTPRAVRPWQHVLEPLYIYLLLIQNSYTNPVLTSGAWNIGPDESQEKTVLDVVALAYQNWDRAPDFELADPGLHEALFLKISSKKLCAKSSWQPVLSFEETVGWTSSWYRDFYQGKTPTKELCHRQIRSFMERIPVHA